MTNQSALTLREIKQSGNRIISPDNGDGFLVTKYGKHTTNYWHAIPVSGNNITGNDLKYHNYACKTVYH